MCMALQNAFSKGQQREELYSEHSQTLSISVFIHLSPQSAPNRFTAFKKQQKTLPVPVPRGSSSPLGFSPSLWGFAFLRLERRALPEAGRSWCSQFLLICISLHGLMSAKPSPGAKRQANLLLRRAGERSTFSCSNICFCP